MQTRLIVAALIAVTPAWLAASAADRFEISNVEVAEAISSLGVQVAPTDVSLLARVDAAVPSPHLLVRAAEQEYNNRLLIRVECSESQNCMPFFVSVNAGEETNARLAVLARAESDAMRPKVRMATRDIAVHSGAPALLLLEGEHVHIRIPVISLQNGTIGQTIRVTGKDSRRIFAAEVVQSGVLRGSL